MTLRQQSVGAREDVCQRLGAQFVKTLLCRGIWDADLYSADAVLWRNTDDHQCPLVDTVSAREIIAAVAAFSVVGVELRAWAGGFVVEFAYAVELADATRLRVPGCIVGAVKGEQISLIHEYIDAASLAPLDDALHRLGYERRAMSTDRLSGSQQSPWYTSAARSRVTNTMTCPRNPGRGQSRAPM